MGTGPLVCQRRQGVMVVQGSSRPLLHHLPPPMARNALLENRYASRAPCAGPGGRHGPMARA